MAIFLIELILFSVSISVTRAAASTIAFLLFNRPALNLIGFIILALFQYLMLCYWPLIKDSAVSSITNLISDLYHGNGFGVYGGIKGFILLELDYYMLAIKNSPINPVEVFRQQAFVYQNQWAILSFYKFDDMVMNTLDLLPNLGRLLLTLIFVGSFALQPLKRPISTLWARIIESDKPVFTLLFGVAAAIAKLIQEIAKNL